MVTKTITITVESYEILAQQKRKEESFSQLIKRIFANSGDITKFFGAWKDIDEKEAKQLHKFIEETRKRAGKQRMREIREQLLS